MTALVVSLSGALAGCQTIVTKYEPLIYTVEVPQALRSCAGLPKRPVGEYTERDVAEFIIRLNAARKDCKIKLKELVDLIERQNANAIASAEDAKKK